MQVGSTILAVMSLIGSYYIGNKAVWVWLYMLFTQMLWLLFGLITEQYGFILSGVGFGAMNLRNYFKWKREALIAQRREQQISTL